MTSPNAASTAAEATTAVSPDPRAIMAALGVSCATCRHWDTATNDDIMADCDAARLPQNAPSGATALVGDRNMESAWLMTSENHFCAMWERHP